MAPEGSSTLQESRTSRTGQHARNDLGGMRWLLTPPENILGGIGTGTHVSSVGLSPSSWPSGVRSRSKLSQSQRIPAPGAYGAAGAVLPCDAQC